jgi:hypothetical protein
MREHDELAQCHVFFVLSDPILYVFKRDPLPDLTLQNLIFHHFLHFSHKARKFPDLKRVTPLIEHPSLQDLASSHEANRAD